MDTAALDSTHTSFLVEDAMREMSELNAVNAVRCPEPYAWYEALARERPFAFDERLGMWVAAGAEVVAAVLESDLCRVRPVAEPVPAALDGSAAGDVFSLLVRMNDGETHGRLKRVVETALASIDSERARAESAAWARELWPRHDAGAVMDFAFALPVHVLGSLLGVARPALPEMVGWVRDFAACIAPGAAVSSVGDGVRAAGELRTLFQGLLVDDPPGLLAELARAEGVDDREVVANAIGFLFQSFDATAGLIGNTMLRLGRDTETRPAASGDVERVQRVILDTLRLDPPIQNTRRFVAHDGVIAGQQVRSGDVILVVLAAANRDECVADSAGFAFGAGAHTCPGRELAVMIAAAGVARLLESGAGLEARQPVSYRASANARIPIPGE